MVKSESPHKKVIFILKLKTLLGPLALENGNMPKNIKTPDTLEFRFIKEISAAR